MKRILTLALAAAAAGTLVAAEIADAKRLGGGRSFGAQRQAVTPPPKAPAATPAPATPAPTGTAAAPPGAAANPVMPAGASAATAAKAAPGAAAKGAATGGSRWLGPVAGLAAGLGLAALASYLGIAEELMSVLLIALVVIAGIVVVRMLMARRAPARTGMPYAGAGPGLGRHAGGYETQVPPLTGRDTAFESPRAASPAAAAMASAATMVPNVPAGFDVDGFLHQARLQFSRLQSAYDRGDRKTLADVMTADMFADVAHEVSDRTHHVATDVVALNAELLDVSTEDGKHWASVRFRGLTREDGEPMPKPFDEIWNLEKPTDGSAGWLLAGIRQVDELPVGHA